ncbi:hypothetical protein D3C74_277580 [compost metagenome]
MGPEMFRSILNAPFSVNSHPNSVTRPSFHNQPRRSPNKELLFSNSPRSLDFSELINLASIRNSSCSSLTNI